MAAEYQRRDTFSGASARLRDVTDGRRRCLTSQGVVGSRALYHLLYIGCLCGPGQRAGDNVNALRR
jgi:hypothetical protein